MKYRHTTGLIDTNRAHICFTRPSKSRFSVIHAEISEVNQFVRAKQYPVILILIQARAKMIAEQQGINGFRAL